MKLTYLLLLLAFNYALAQSSFQAGNYTDSSGNTIEGLIKNVDWANPPSSFTFKSSEAADAITIETANIQSFQIYGTSHYYKNITIEAYKDYVQDGLEVEKPAQSFLARVLLEGEASLYRVLLDSRPKFIFQMKDQNYLMLVNTEYIDRTGVIRTQKDFQRLLYENLKCDGALSIKDFLNLKYQLKDLNDVLQKYNTCKGASGENFQSKKVKGEFRFKANVFANYVNFSDNSINVSSIIPGPPSSGGGGPERIEANLAFDFDSQLSVGVGVELEYLLPFNNKSWGVYIAPNYRYFSEDISEALVILNGMPTDLRVVQKSGFSYIEIPLGLRYYFNIAKKLKSYVSFAYSYNALIEDSTIIEFPNEVEQIDDFIEQQDANSSIFIGAGIGISNRIDIGIDYYILSKVSTDGSFGFNLAGSLSLVARYRLF